jgi:hypothetical protein
VQFSRQYLGDAMRVLQPVHGIGWTMRLALVNRFES